MGSCRSVQCDNVVKDIWNWAIANDIYLSASHIPGVLNVEADAESRKSEVRTEWRLNEDVFQNMISYFNFKPSIDLFASRVNTKLKQFIAYRPDPEAVAINSFSVSWSDLKFYSFPPFSCVGKVLQKITQDQATGLIIVPDWPNQPWYGSLFDICIVDPYIIPPSVNQLYLPNQPQLHHPLFKSLGLLACHVSGKVINRDSYPRRF